MNFSYTETREIFDARTDIEETFSMGFIGASLDQRGNRSRATVRGAARRTSEIRYNPKNFGISVNNDELSLREYLEEQFPEQVDSILIDATNLAFPEIVILLRKAIASGQIRKVSFVYCEPESYLKVAYFESETRYELSDDLEEPQFIPSFYRFSRGQKKSLFAFLGFEPRRFSRIVDPDVGEEFNEITPIFAVPPYKPGYEKVSFEKNSRVLEKVDNKDCLFVPSNHPYNALTLLRRQFALCQRYQEEMVIAPVGNKPCSIATAMLAAENEDVSVIFDFPTKRSNRSNGVEKVYLFSALIE